MHEIYRPPDYPVDPVPDKLRGPAIGLIVAGSLNAVITALTLLAALLDKGSASPTFESDAERAGYYFGQGAALVAAGLSLVAAPLLIYGGIQMLKGLNYSMARAAAILAIVPCTSYCCVVGIPLGVWALMTLNKPEVAAYFAGARPGSQYPQPPSPW